jgi:hypothetical protein
MVMQSLKCDFVSGDVVGMMWSEGIKWRTDLAIFDD